VAPPVFTERFGGVTVTGGTFVFFGPPAPTKRWIVHAIDVRMVNNDPVALGGVHLITAGSLEDVNWQCPCNTVKCFAWRGQKVLDAGETFEVRADGSSLFTAAVSFTGAELSLP
jgi:hypothetical protein